MNRLIVKNDLITGSAMGPVGIDRPLWVENLPLERLRFDGLNVVDAEGYSSFYIDSLGRKHIDQTDPDWQQLDCQWNDELVNDGTWRVVTTTDFLANTINSKRSQVNRAADNALASITRQYPRAEIDSWTIQIAEAEAWTADNNAATPFIDGLLSRRPGKEKTELVGSILANAASYKLISADVFGQRQALDDELDAAATVEAVQAIVVAIEVVAP